MQVYIKGKSKKQLNEQIVAGKDVVCYEYNMTGCNMVLFSQLPENSVIKIFEKYIAGNPYAKSYGIKKGGKIK